jgi:chromosome segregation ATPase
MGEEMERPTGPPSTELFEKQIIYKQKLEERAAKAEEKLGAEEKLRKNIEDKQVKTLKEKNDLMSQLEMERGSLGEFNEKLGKVTSQKKDLEHQLAVIILKKSIFRINFVYFFL